MDEREPADPSRAGSAIRPGGADTPAESHPTPADPRAEEYRKYREAEREEEKRLERYERTKSIDTVHTREDDEK